MKKILIITFLISLPLICLAEEPQIDFQHIWSLRFDTVPANENSIISKPEEITTEMLPRMIERDDKLMFFDEEGEVKKEINITRKFYDTVNFSKHKSYVVVKKHDKMPGEGSPAKIHVYNKEGNLQYEFNGNTDFYYRVSEKGICAEIDYVGEGGRFRFINTVGNTLKEVDPGFITGCITHTQVEGRFSGDGEKFALIASDCVGYPYTGVDSYVVLYDENANEIFRKKLVSNPDWVRVVDISENGNRILVTTDLDGRLNTAFLLDNNGNIVKVIEDVSALFPDNLKYDTKTNAFIANSLRKQRVIDSQGNKVTIEIKDKIASNCISKDYMATVALVEKKKKEKKKEKEHKKERKIKKELTLYLYDREGNLLLKKKLHGNTKGLKTTSCNFVTDDIIAVRFSNEMSYYKISRIEK